MITKEEYNMKTDIWSLGVTFAYLMLLASPFQRGSLRDTFHAISNRIIGPENKFPDIYSEDMQAFVYSMLEIVCN